MSRFASPLIWVLVLLCAACGGDAAGRPLPELIAALDAADEAERWRAIEVIVERGAESIPALSACLRRPGPAPTTEGIDRQRDGRFYAAQALGALAPDSIGALLDALAADEEVARIHAQHVLRGLSLGPTHIDRLGQLLAHENVMTAGRAGELLRGLSPAEVERALEPTLGASQPLMRRRALRTIEMREDGWGWPVLRRLLDDPDPDVRAETLKVLAERLGAGAAWDEAAPALIAHLDGEPVERNRAWVAAALEAHGASALPHVLGAMVAKPTSPAAAYMPGVLEAIGSYDAYVLDALSDLAGKGSPLARVRAMAAGWSLLKRAEAEGAPVHNADRTQALEQEVGDRLLELASSEDRHARVEALIALGRFPARSAQILPRLGRAFASDNLDTITAGLRTAAALKDIAYDELVAMVTPLRKHSDREIREIAESWLSYAGTAPVEIPEDAPEPDGSAPDGAAPDAAAPDSPSPDGPSPDGGGADDDR